MECEDKKCLPMGVTMTQERYREKKEYEQFCCKTVKTTKVYVLIKLL